MKVPDIDKFLLASDSFLPENEPGIKRLKPRASGIAACARQNAFMMAGSSVTNPSTPDAKYTQEQGRIIEDLSIKALGRIGYPIVDRQVSLPDDFFVSGHPDGRVDDSSVGFEHKHFGRYKYLDIFKNGLEKSAPEILVQTGCYAEGLGWDSVLACIVSQDASALRGDHTANLRAKNPKVRWSTLDNWNPKVQIFLIDLKPVLVNVMPVVRQRAKALTRWATSYGKPEDVWQIKREFEPEGKDAKFPCGYCDFRDTCVEMGQSGDPIPFLPFMHIKTEEVDV